MNKGVKILMWTAMGVAFVLAFGYITMVLWNWLIPSIFNFNPINFYQALGLLLLCKILFGGFGGKRWNHNGGHWKSRYYQKISGMSPEDRERFKARMKEKWCSPAEKTSEPKAGSSNV